MEMLVLSRKKDEKIVIGDSITIMVLEIRGDKVRLGIDAPREVSVHREEVWVEVQKAKSVAVD
jgi:carbon storage regulator